MNIVWYTREKSRAWGKYGKRWIWVMGRRYARIRIQIQIKPSFPQSQTTWRHHSNLHFYSVSNFPYDSSFWHFKPTQSRSLFFYNFQNAIFPPIIFTLLVLIKIGWKKKCNRFTKNWYKHWIYFSWYVYFKFIKI